MSSQFPLISVIVPTYQHAKTLPMCLDSILAQTYRPIELIIVNDGSTDETAQVIRHYTHAFAIKGMAFIAIDQTNQGSNLARNHGFQASHGEFVLFCDADIVMEPDMLKKMYHEMRVHPEAAYVYSSFRFGWKRFRSFQFDPNRLKHFNYIHTTSLIRRRAFPGFDESIRRLQDWDIWLTMLEQGNKGAFIHGELFRVLLPHGRDGISQWRPKLFYKIPWRKLGYIPKSIRCYEEAKRVIMNKHSL